MNSIEYILFPGSGPPFAIGGWRYKPVRLREDLSGRRPQRRLRGSGKEALAGDEKALTGQAEIKIRLQGSDYGCARG